MHPNYLPLLKNARSGTQKPLLFFVLLFAITPLFFAFAQALPGPSVAIELDPAVPGPFKEVVATAISYEIDLDRRELAWFMNGQSTQAGVGEKRFVFTTGDVGTPIKLELYAKGFKRAIATAIIIPGEVDLLWEAVDSYTPPFYRGRALPTSESTIKVVALPRMKNADGFSLAPENVVYKWNRNYNYYEFNKNPRYGNHTILFARDFLREEERIEVEVSSLDEGTRVEASILVQSGDPEVVLYERHPLQNIRYETAIGKSFTLQGGEATFVAEPYFFSAQKRGDAGLLYEWSQNGKPIPARSATRSGEQTFSAGLGAGTANIGISVRRIAKTLQVAQKFFDIKFTGGTSGQSF